MTKPPAHRTFTLVHRQRLARAADHYLRECYRTHTSVRAADFAAGLGMTPEYVSWLARRIFGKPLRDYLRGKQLQHAAHLLRTLPPEITIDEIALQAGFGASRTFYRRFTEAYGTSPGAWRELKK
jgi:AraC family transcriptional regulator